MGETQKGSSLSISGKYLKMLKFRKPDLIVFLPVLRFSPYVKILRQKMADTMKTKSHSSGGKGGKSLRESKTMLEKKKDIQNKSWKTSRKN